MKNRILKLIPIMLVTSLIFTACDKEESNNNTQNSGNMQAENMPIEDGMRAEGEMVSVETKATQIKNADNKIQNEIQNEEKTQDYFSTRDLSGEFDASEAVEIKLEGDSIMADSDAVNISDSTVTITDEGTYLISGSLKDGCVIVNADKEDKVQLVLDGVSINSEDFAAIYVSQADKVFVTLAEGSSSVLTNGGSFSSIDESNVDGVIYSKDDITLNGAGSLQIESPNGHGIVGKDEVTITNGEYVISSSQTSIKANDSIAIADGSFKLSAGTDGLHAENNEDDSLGSIYIKGGTFDISSGDDGIHATTSLQIDGGTYNISAVEGMEATYITINDGDITISASDDGINAAQKSSSTTPTIIINGGNINITMGAGDTDGIDVNGNIEVNGGTVNVTGNSTFDYDGTGVINGGTVIVNGEEVTTLPSQMMGGHGGMGGQDGQNNQGGMGAQNGQNNQGGMGFWDGQNNQGGMGAQDGQNNHGRMDAPNGIDNHGGMGIPNDQGRMGGPLSK